MTRLMRNMMAAACMLAAQFCAGSDAGGVAAVGGTDGNPRAPLSYTPVENILLVGWDGVQRHHLMELMEDGDLPNLRALVEEGSFETIGISGHATDTKSGWTQILTGYNPHVTGVYSNGRYKPIPEGLSIFERVEKRFGSDKIFTAMVTGKGKHVGSMGPGAPAGGKRGRRTEKFGQPYHFMRDALDIWDGDRQRDAGTVGPAAIEALTQAQGMRFLCFAHFSDPDHAGHKFGENSREYGRAIEECDAWLGRMVKWLKEKNLYEKTRIYVVTDHGFDEGGKSHRYAPRTWLATNDNAVIKGGHMRDIAPTILTRMGVDIWNLEPKYPSRPLIDAVPFPNLKKRARRQ